MTLMADIDFLSSQKTGKGDSQPKKPQKAAAPADEFSMHVPEPQKPPEAKNAVDPGLFGGLKELFPKTGPVSVPDDLLRTKLSATPAAEGPGAPKKPPLPPPPPAMKVPPPPPPPPRQPPAPPKPPQPPQKAVPPPAPQKGGGTLRVSLISTGAGASMSDLTVRERLRAFLLVMVIALVVVAGIEGGILFYKSRVLGQQAGLENDLRDLDAKISDAERRTAPARNLQILMSNADKALKNHKHWTKMLKVVESLALPQVQFLNLAAGETGSMSMGIIAKDYTTLAKQIVLFGKDPRIKSYSYGAASGREGGAGTNITLTVDPKLLLSSGDESPEGETTAPVSEAASE
jgi:hypothetical protein